MMLKYWTEVAKRKVRNFGTVTLLDRYKGQYKDQSLCKDRISLLTGGCSSRTLRKSLKKFLLNTAS